MTTMDTAATMRGLYGASPEYTNALAEFLIRHAWELHPNQHRRCLTLLDRPNHKCSRQCLYDFPAPSSRRGNFDHVLVLRRGPASRPRQWAFLSQPYCDDDPSGRAQRLGPAPYGHGTTALLYVGSEATP